MSYRKTILFACFATVMPLLMNLNLSLAVSWKQSEIRLNRDQILERLDTLIKEQVEKSDPWGTPKTLWIPFSKLNLSRHLTYNEPGSIETIPDWEKRLHHEFPGSFRSFARSFADFQTSEQLEEANNSESALILVIRALINKGYQITGEFGGLRDISFFSFWCFIPFYEPGLLLKRSYQSSHQLEKVEEESLSDLEPTSDQEEF